MGRLADGADVAQRNLRDVVDGGINLLDCHMDGGNSGRGRTGGDKHEVWAEGRGGRRP